MGKTLDVLKNTDYVVDVTRHNISEDSFYYQVDLREPVYPVGDLFVTEYDLVGSRTMSKEATKRQLEAVVQTLMDTAKPLLVGTYTGEKEEEEEIYVVGD